MRKIFETIRRRKSKNSGLAELAKMDERMLADLGLIRADVARLVHGLKSLSRVAPPL